MVIHLLKFLLQRCKLILCSRDFCFDLIGVALQVVLVIIRTKQPEFFSQDAEGLQRPFCTEAALFVTFLLVGCWLRCC